MNIQLYNDDCLNVLRTIPDKSIDLVVTDPPYELDNHGGGTTELATRKLVSDTENYIDFMSSGFNYDSLFNELIRILKIPNMFIFCSNKQVSKIMSYFENMKLSTTLLCWNKTNPSPLCNGKYLSDLEFIVYVRGKGSTFNNDTPFDYKRKCYTSGIVPTKDRLHTAQKPVELLKRYILLCSNPCETVLDCFMGSGSTGVACVETNRNFVGIEIDKNYFDISKQRIHDAQDQIKLF